jgi:asparagine N-glycosylation enzyme membrane subunit Stt3
MVVVALAAFMPWASIFGISKVGIEGDGVITLILAIIGAVILAISTGVVGRPRSPGRLSQIGLLALAVLVALVGVVDMSGVSAIGLYLTFFGGVAWVVGATWQLARGAKSRTAGIG